MVTVTVDQPAAFIRKLLKCCFTHRSEAGYYYIHNNRKTSIEGSRTLICCAERRIFAFFPNVLAGSGMKYRSLSLLTGLDLINNIDIKAPAPQYLINLQLWSRLEYFAALHFTNRWFQINEKDPKRRFCHIGFHHN